MSMASSTDLPFEIIEGVKEDVQQHDTARRDETINEEHVNPGIQRVQDNTNSSSEDEETDEVESVQSNENSAEEQIDGYVEMPLLKYGRINGSLPRTSSTTQEGVSNNSPLSIPCKCSALGRVVIQPSRSMDSTGLGLSLSDSRASEQKSASVALLQSKIQIYSVLALAFEDGSIQLLDAKTGENVCPSDQLKVKLDGSRVNIVALSFDSGSNYLGALTDDGHVSIFELKYGVGVSAKNVAGNTIGNLTMGQDRSQVQQQGRPEKKLFNSFLSRLAGDVAKFDSEHEGSLQMTGSNISASSRNETEGQDERLLNTLMLNQPVSTARFTYKTPSSTAKATCLAIDPGYNRKREKGILVGFDNGRLVYTKRSSHGGVAANDLGFGGVMGNLLQPKRQDLDLYQGLGGKRTEENGIGGNGIETVAWRGKFISWADESGIKIFDIEKLNRVAHIDRPSGARASLYPHISDLRPKLLFERSDSLLICWGDCLMNMIIIHSKDADINAAKRISVKCEMAWELDCVGCDVQSIDAEFVAVLGLTSKTVQNDTEDDEEQNKTLMEQHFVELQIIKRSDGSLTASDVLPLAVSDATTNAKPCTQDFVLSSSFSASRMEDSIEAEGEEMLVEEAADIDIQNIIMNTMVSSINEERPKKKFTDQHMRWSIESYRQSIIDKHNEEDDDTSTSSVDSEDSDDYTFIFRQEKNVSCSAKTLTNVPIMVVRSRDDAVLTQIRDVDDSIEHAQINKNYGHALRHGLNHRQMLRKHSLAKLIDDYFTAVLNPSDNIEDYECPRPLTIRRLEVAAKATPILFGGDLKLWEHWVYEFSCIPGGLLILRPYIPVRDPKLPAGIYNIFLLSMYKEISEMLLKGVDESDSVLVAVHDNAVDLFLGAIRAWGASSSLRDRMKLHLAVLEDGIEGRNGDNDQNRLYQEAKSSLSARMNQSASVYLNYEGTIDQAADDIPASMPLPPSGVTSDSLFAVDAIKSFFEKKLKEIRVSSLDTSFSRSRLAVLEVLAELYFMEGSYSKALEMYLKIGSQLSRHNLRNIEDDVLDSVFDRDVKYSDPESYSRHKHVMKMVKSNELHRLLVDATIVENEELPPIVALICLVGLEDAGQFIIEHCMLPESKSCSTQAVALSLSLDLVAKQLKAYPKLLLWLLQDILCNRPEIYVKFPNTAVPPSSVTKLHKIHFDLLVEFGRTDSMPKMKLSDIPSFDDITRQSPMLIFLKAALPHGGVRSDDVRLTLERHRAGKRESASNKKPEYPYLFAHELAYIIERSGKGSEEDATKVLNLYLEGVVSLPHAVVYAERNIPYSSMLWESLITYCLYTAENGVKGTAQKSDGKLFGSLLEVAARSGANLAHLVSKIPTNMKIDGIRHRLVAAISDYQTKQNMHKAAFGVLSHDKVALLREQYYLSKRGTHVKLYANEQSFVPVKKRDDQESLKIVLKPWKEGKERLASKRKMRQGRAMPKGTSDLGISLPRSLEIH